MREHYLSLIEMYESIQGETSFAGLMTSFVRLAGCPLRCRWCDSTFSFAKGEPHSLSSIMNTIEQFGWRHVCVTGGEPLLQTSVIPLLHTLIEKNYVVSLETNGSLSTVDVPEGIHVILDIKCPNSGMSESNDWSNLSRLTSRDEVKFVITDRIDYDWAKETISKYSLFDKAGHVLLSPVADELDPKDLVDWMVRDKLPARLNIQLHKVVWEPLKRGV